MSDAGALTQSHFEKAFADAAIGMAVVALDGRFLMVNPPLAEIVGYSPEELLELDFAAITHPEDRERDVGGLRRLVSGEIRTYRTEKRYLHKSGRVVWILLAASLVRDERGAPLHVVSQMQDITELKDALSALRESEARYRFLVDNTPDVIYCLEPDGRVTAVNRAFCEALGLPESAIVGKHYRQLGFPEALAQEWDELLRRAAEGELVRGETTAVFPSGEVRTYDVMLTPVHGDEGVVRIRGVSRNVTERRRLEVQLRQAQKMEAIGRLAGGLAHDFNNIMTVIQAYAHFLRAKVRTDEPLREDIDEICKAAERAEHLTRQLLAFSRKSMVELRQLNLNHLVLDMKNMLGRILGEEVDLEVSDAPSLWPVRADLGQMEQVLTNLVVNARDAMPRGGKLTIETANVDIAGETDSARSDGSPGQYVVLRVTDTGEGMPPEVQERVFEPFFTTKKPGRGTGLGLATVYGIVKQAGGFITLDSEVGKGTRIQVHLPRLRGPSARQSSSPSKPPDALLGGGRVVLLVEDEPALRRAVCRMLEQLGFEVVEAGNGREALEKVRQATKPFDLILTDVVMPVMNGKELIDEVHAIHPKLPVVYMSGYTEDAIVEHGVLAPDTVFLAKPFSVDELVAKLRQVLSARAER